jgi:hypothetical protein
MSASDRTELIVFLRGTTSEDEYGQQVEGGTSTIATRRARVRFGTAQEKREAAQDGGAQSATFECVRSSTLEGVKLGDRITYLGSNWDITEIAPLDRATIRFTATRVL